MIENLKYFTFYNFTFIMHFTYYNIVVIILYYIIDCLSIKTINENNNGLPFCFNLSRIFFEFFRKNKIFYNFFK